jgi:hypothetical protein
MWVYCCELFVVSLCVLEFWFTKFLKVVHKISQSCNQNSIEKITIVSELCIFPNYFLCIFEKLNALLL